MSQSQSRSQRRSYEKWLKKNNPQSYKEWKSTSINRGNRLHLENVESVRKSHEDFFESAQTNMIAKLQNEGKSTEEIDRYVSIWIKTIQPWATPEKALSLKDAVKEYELENSVSDDNNTAN